MSVGKSWSSQAWEPSVIHSTLCGVRTDSPSLVDLNLFSWYDFCSDSAKKRKVTSFNLNFKKGQKMMREDLTCLSVYFLRYRSSQREHCR